MKTQKQQAVSAPPNDGCYSCFMLILLAAPAQGFFSDTALLIEGIVLVALIFLSLLFLHRQVRHKTTALEDLYKLQNLIINSSSVGIALIRDRRFVWINPRACELLNMTAEELKGAPTRTIYPDDETAEYIGREGYAALQAGTRWECEVQVIRKGGAPFWCRLFANPVNPEDLDAGSLWMMEDISEKKTTEEQLKLLSTAIEQSPEIILITDTEGTIQYVNPAFERVTGYSRQEAIGRNPRILKSGHQSPEFYEELWTTVLSGKVWSGRLINRRKKRKTLHRRGRGVSGQKPERNHHKLCRGQAGYFRPDHSGRGVAP